MWWDIGLASPPCPHVNAGRLIPNDALAGIKQVQKTLKKQLEMFGKLAQRFLDVESLFCGAARPTPPATWDVASQIVPYGAGKKKRKENNSLRLFTKNMRKFYAHKGIIWD